MMLGDGRTRGLLAAATLLAGCAWNPVLEPYAVADASGRPADAVATVWGVRSGAKLHFTHVDGVALPSRGGGGYPVSLTLSPGEHELRIFFAAADHRWTERKLKTQFDAGHTYVTEYLFLPEQAGVLIRLADQGPGQRCAYQRTDAVSGAAALSCTAPAAAPAADPPAAPAAP